MNLPWMLNWLGVTALMAGLCSAVLYGRRAGGKQRWIDAALVLAAALALAALLAEPAPQQRDGGEVAVASDVPGDALARALLAVPEAGVVALSGHGLTEAQWQDLPARPLRWDMPQGDVLALEFARTVPLGREFTLTVRRSAPTPGWRLQLLAENGQVLAEAAAGAGAEQASVSWLPPLAEQLVLRARLLDSNGKAFAEGPVPLRVTEPAPLQVVGRFGAPSFDTRRLNDLLTASGAIVDWQTTLGKGLLRTESARAALPQPHAQFIDAAWFEAAPQPARAALLGQVAQGLPLVVLGGSAAQPGVWQQELALPLAPQSATTEKEDARVFGSGAQQIALAPASFNPAAQAGAWQVLARDLHGKPWLWQRGWKQGGIVWVGVADWHRHAITAPAALGAWWQTLIDAAVRGSVQQVLWEQPDAMPVAGLRTQICAQGGTQDAAPGKAQQDALPGAGLTVQGLAPAPWQARAGRAEGVCAAFIPVRAGWHALSSGGAQHALYVYGERDWPQWRQGLRQQATRAYAARSPLSAAPRRSSPGAALPSWPFALVLAAALLALWWRERKSV